MLLDWIWIGGQVLCFAALLFGAYWVLIESEPFLTLQGKTSSVPVFLSPGDFRQINRFCIDGKGCINCGNSAIDAEHQEFLDHLIALRGTVLRGGTVAEISLIIDALIGDLRRHFQDEEAVLAAVNYPGIATHASLHQGIIESAGSLLAKFRSGRLAISSEFQSLFGDVYGAHTLAADREFISYLQAAH